MSRQILSKFTRDGLGIKFKMFCIPTSSVKKITVAINYQRQVASGEETRITDGGLPTVTASEYVEVCIRVWLHQSLQAPQYFAFLNRFR